MKDWRHYRDEWRHGRCRGEPDSSSSWSLNAILVTTRHEMSIRTWWIMANWRNNASDVVRMCTVPFSPATHVGWRRQPLSDWLTSGVRSVNAPLHKTFQKTEFKKACEPHGWSGINEHLPIRDKRCLSFLLSHNYPLHLANDLGDRLF
jgi:hypothetical protein